MDKRPKRTAEHNLEESSNRFFHQCLPENWTTTKPNNDYGVDWLINIFDGEYASNYELNVQLKSSQKSTKGEHEKISFRVATYNHLKNLLHVVMIIKYIKSENEAYWTLLVDIDEPNQEQDTFTIKIPKKNKLSSINWAEIESYIREIVDCKLTAAEALRNRRKQQNKTH